MTAAENTADFRALAQELLEEFGVEMDWTVTSGGTYDPTTGAVSGTTSTVYSDVLTSPPVPVDSHYWPADVVKEADAVFYLADPLLSFTPGLGQTVDFNGETWVVLKVQSFYPGASAAAHALAVRRG